MKTELVTKASRTLHKVGFKFKKHSPEILAVVGVAGTIASGVLACKATLKVNDIVDEARKLQKEKGLDYKMAYRIALTEYIDYITRNNCNHKLNINVIIPPGADIDNGEIFDIKSGKTIKNLF